MYDEAIKRKEEERRNANVKELENGSTNINI